MKQGVSFEQLVEHVEQEAESRRDYYVPTDKMELVTDDSGSLLVTPCGQFRLQEPAHRHLAELVGVDRRYYQRMRREAPFLLDENVNHWLDASPSKPRIIRALEDPAGSDNSEDYANGDGEDYATSDTESSDVASTDEPYSLQRAFASSNNSGYDNIGYNGNGYNGNGNGYNGATATIARPGSATTNIATASSAIAASSHSATACTASARAIVSSRYAMLDNDALLRTVEPVIDELGLTVESCDVSEEKLFIKMVSPRLKGEVKVGDEVQAGIIVRNSEVRCSAVEVDWFVMRLVCLNGMIVTGPHGRSAFRRHVGRDWTAAQRRAHSGHNGSPYGSYNGAYNGELQNGSHNGSAAHSLPCGLLPDDPEREAWERDIWHQFRSSLRESLNQEAFSDLLERLTATTNVYSGVRPDDIVARVGAAYHLRPGEQEAMLHHLLRESDMSLWGVINAVTRTAGDVTEYGRATDLEELGGKLAHLSPRAWTRLVQPN